MSSSIVVSQALKEELQGAGTQHTESLMSDELIASVRQFLPSHQSNASRSSLKHHHLKSPALQENKQNSGNGENALMKLEMNGLMSMINSEGELILKNQKINAIPRSFCHLKFEKLKVLDIRGNEITKLDEEICKNLCMIKRLDIRNNKLKELSPQIKAMMQLQVLRLDHNELCNLPSELGELQMLQELSIADNKVQNLPLSLSKLKCLQILNIADNHIKHLPPELGELRDLKTLNIHGNRFTQLPCTFVHLAQQLEEMSLEWFMYAKPPRSKLVKRDHQDGREIFEQMIVLCNLLQKYKMNECALVTFLENYSTQVFNINSIDNRLRTPLHNAAVKGDNGVLEGLLLGKADTNILDKDNCTPLCLAIREENFDAAVVLITAGVDVNLGGGIFGSPMHLAVVKLEVWIVKKLIMSGVDVNKADCDGNTPLHFVMNVFSKNPLKCQSIAELLILNGAKVNCKNNDNWAPLHLAARKGQEKGIQTVIKLNLSLKEKGIELFDLNITGGAQQWTAIHLAAHGGFFQIVKDFVAAGVDIFMRNLSNQLPRHCAKGNYILTKYLKQAEMSRSKQTYGSCIVHNQYELLHNVTKKLQKPSDSDNSSQLSRSKTVKKTTSNMVEEYSLNYDTFLNNLAQLKVTKAFTDIDIVRKGHSFISSSTQQPQSLTPCSKLNLDILTGADKGFSQTMNSHMLSFPDTKGDSRFSKLNLKAEEKKVNLFYLKDILTKETSSTSDRLEALFKIKRNLFKPVFGSAMRSLLPQLAKVEDTHVQTEIIQAISMSGQHQLLGELQEQLNNFALDSSVLDEIADAIAQLQLAKSKPQAFTVNNQQSSISKHTEMMSRTQNMLMGESFENARSVNSFKMKGMGSLLSNGPPKRQEMVRSSAGTPAAMHKSHMLQNLTLTEQDRGRKGSQALPTPPTSTHATKLMMQTQPLRKILGNQNGALLEKLPLTNATATHQTPNQPKPSQLARKKQSNSRPLNTIAILGPHSRKQLPNQHQGSTHQSRIQHDHLRHYSNQYEEQMSAGFPYGEEYSARGPGNQTRSNLMATRGSGETAQRSHSLRNSVSIPAKK